MRALIFAMIVGFVPPTLAITEIQMWHSMSGPKRKLVDQLVSEFNQLPENKGKTKAIAQYVGTYPEGINKLRTALIGKRAPHVAQVYDIGTQVMIDSNAVVPLQQFMDKDPSFSSTDMLPQIRRYYEIGGSMYSLPFSTSNPIIYYNADWFKKAGIKSPPKTFAELESVAKKLTNASTKKTGITWPLHSWFFEEFVARQGSLLTNNDNGRKGRATEVFFNSEAGIAYVSLWARMVKAGTFANVGRGWEPANHNFLAGHSAMMITSTSDVFELSNQASFTVKTAPIPTKDLSVPGGTPVGGNSLWILKKKNQKEQQAAYRLVRFFGSKAIQERWHTNTGYFPIRQDVITKLEREGFYKKYPAALTAIDQLRNSANVPATNGALLGIFPQARENIESAIEQVLTGRASVKEALKKAKQKTDRALKRYNRGKKPITAG